MRFAEDLDYLLAVASKEHSRIVVNLLKLLKVSGEKFISTNKNSEGTSIDVWIDAFEGRTTAAQY